MLVLICLLSEHRNQFTRCDLIIQNMFSGADMVADRVIESGLFENVHIGKNLYPRYNHLGTTYLLNTWFKRKKSDARFFDMFPALKGELYDVLLCSCASYCSLDAKRLCVPYGHTIFYDDGLGTHTGMVFRIFACFDYGATMCAGRDTPKEEIKKILKRMVLPFIPTKCKLNISDLYMFCPTEKDNKMYAPFDVHPISINQKNLCLAEAVLVEGVDSVRRYLQAETIFLTIPDDFDTGINDLEMSIIEKLEAVFDNSIFIKLHPRRNKKSFSKFSSLVLEQYPWELLIAQRVVSDKTILIGLCSSAQVMPKLLFGIEPRVVFLDDLIRMPSREAREQAMNEVLNDYQNKDRVLRPKTFDELVLNLNIFRNTEV